GERPRRPPHHGRRRHPLPRRRPPDGRPGRARGGGARRRRGLARPRRPGVRRAGPGARRAAAPPLRPVDSGEHLNHSPTTAEWRAGAAPAGRAKPRKGLKKIDLSRTVAIASQDTSEILASLTLVTDIFTISGESSGIVAGPAHDRDGGMTASRVHLHDLAGT